MEETQEVAEALEAVELTATEHHRVILQDVERTRAEMPLFKAPEVQLWLRRALTLYCLREGADYMQVCLSAFTWLTGRQTF